MKLKKEIVDKLNNPPTRRRISAKLKSCGDQAIYKHLRGNSDNGRLTKMDALKAIAEETGLTVDQLLEDPSEERRYQQPAHVNGHGI
ncbi:MAG TPA: hypothetical protein VEB42_17035 [Chitinophagaceae bacterium]|nr:hypothetical protein [Chitinophagaceae bacterium]